MSRKHTRIVVEDAWATIEDLGSKNGTFIGTTRVIRRRELRDGDVVRLSGVPATFRADGAVGSTHTLSDCQNANEGDPYGFHAALKCDATECKPAQSAFMAPSWR